MSSVLAYNSKSVLATSDSFPLIMSHIVQQHKFGLQTRRMCVQNSIISCAKCYQPAQNLNILRKTSTSAHKTCLSFTKNSNSVCFSYYYPVRRAIVEALPCMWSVGTLQSCTNVVLMITKYWAVFNFNSYFITLAWMSCILIWTA